MIGATLGGLIEYWPLILADVVLLTAVVCALWWRFAGHRLRWWAAIIDRSATWGLGGAIAGFVVVMLVR